MNILNDKYAVFGGKFTILFFSTSTVLLFI